MHKTVSILSLFLLTIVGVSSGAAFTDYLGAGHWAGGVNQSSYLSQTGLVTVGTNAQGNQLWGMEHGNNATGYGMWVTQAGGGGDQWNAPMSYDPGDPLGAPPAWVEYELDDVYSLTSMWVWNYNQSGATNRGLKDVSVDVSADGVTWTRVYQGVFAQATGQNLMSRTDYFIIGPIQARYIVINGYTNWGDTGGPYYGLSEVRWDITQPIATNPVPADGSTVEGRQVPMSWMAGNSIVQHDVYFGTDVDAVTDATVANPLGVYKGRQSAVTYNPGTLDYGTTYYWRIDEVDASNNIIIGYVWSFTVADYLSIENYESYVDAAAMKAVWIEVPGTGATIDLATKVVLDEQSMQLSYANAAAPYYSSVRREFAAAQDWLEGGLFKSLSLSFFGNGSNTATGLSLIVEDSLGQTVTVPYNGDIQNLRRAQWTEWRIAFTQLAGVDLTKVKKLTLRVGNGSSASTGVVYIDNIRRYVMRCLETPVGDIDGDCVSNIKDFSELASTWMMDAMWP